MPYQRKLLHPVMVSLHIISVSVVTAADNRKIDESQQKK